MKRNLIASLALLTLITGAHSQSSHAAEPARVQVSYGIGFLPLDFYIDRREQLGLNDDQVHAMQKILGNMREPGEKLAREMQERTKALQDAIGQNPVNADAAMERFKAVLDAENQTKAMQFRARMEMRQVLKPEQYEKVRAMAAHAQQGKQGKASGNLQDKLNQVRQQLARRTGGKVPGEVVEQLERIEQAARQGHGAEAEKQLNALLHQIQGGQDHGQGNIEQQMRELGEAMKKARTHEEREEIEQHMRKLRGTTGQQPKGAPHASGSDLKKTIHQIDEAAEHSDKPEVREQLMGAVAKIKEAAAAEKPEVIQDILQAIKPLLKGRGPKP